MGTFILDELTGAATLLATNRVKRPDETGVVNNHKPGQTENPPVDKQLLFSKGYEHLTPPSVYRDAADWNVRVFKNKYPLVDDHEIIIHSPDRDKDIDELPLEQNMKIIRAFLNRVSYFGEQDKEVMIFNNRGGRAGASITHTHSQIIALKGFPGIIEKEKESALKYYNENNSCFWCDMIKNEVSDGSRIIYESTHFVLLVPPACRWSYEMLLIPKNHKPNFGFIDETEINDLSVMLKSALSSYNTLFNKPDRNFWIHTVRYEPYHWHMGFIAHLKVFGGVELGAGIWVSDKASPEDSAKQLREHVKFYCELEV